MQYWQEQYVLSNFWHLGITKGLSYALLTLPCLKLIRREAHSIIMVLDYYGMNKQRPIVREKILFWALLVLVLAVLVNAPLHYGFIYPTGGDDTAHHIRYLSNLTENFGYVKNMSYYGLTLLIPFTHMGFSSLTVFSVFNYAVILAVFIVLWILVRRFYGLIGAALSFYISVFIVMGTWYYFENGTIFNIFNLFVVGILAIFSLCIWLESGRYRWLLTSGFLFIMTSLVHNSTYLYIMASMLLFIAGFAAYQFMRRDKVMLKKILSFGAVFIFSILTAWVTWMHKALPEFGESMVSSVTRREPPFAAPFTLPDWITHYLNIGIVFLLALALVILAIILIKGKAEDKRNLIAKFNQPLSYILLSFMVVLSVGTFTLLGYNSDRFARDLGTFVGLTSSILLGVAITHYRLKVKNLLIVILVVILLTTNTPMHRWLGDYTALRPCDVQAIDYLNTIPFSQVEVQTSSTVAPWIFQLYTNDNITYERIYDLKDYREADYILYRNNHMTYRTETKVPEDHIPLESDTLEHLESLVRVAEFYSENNIIKIYKVVK